ncbi:MAG TPA: acyl-CoA carboxylase subunit epsilon, partial [Streptosporangiaceae bacterium]
APLLTVVRGEPTAEEIAAVLAVLTARAAARLAPAGPQPPAQASRSALSQRSGLMRTSLWPGPGAWKRSALPR